MATDARGDQCTEAMEPVGNASSHIHPSTHPSLYLSIYTSLHFHLPHEACAPHLNHWMLVWAKPR